MRNRLIWLAAVIFCAGSLAYLARGLISEYLLVPFVHIYRILGLVYQLFPQFFWWSLFLLFLGYLFLRMAPWDRAYVSRSEPVPEENTGPVRSWSRLIDAASRGNYSRWLLVRRTLDLYIRMIAYQQRLQPKEVRDQLKTGQLVLPSEIKPYLQMGLEAPSFRHYAELAALVRSFRRSSDFDIELEVIIEYLEKLSTREA
jgi:hypothetical protein